MNAEHSAWDLWAGRLGAFAVAVVVAYASYQHQRAFALAGGADLTTARLWPLSVDGLLVISTAGLLRGAGKTDIRGRFILRAAFGASIIVSLAVNIATAPVMTWAPILVAGWPRSRCYWPSNWSATSATETVLARTSETLTETTRRKLVTIRTERVITLGDSPPSRYTAEQVMWDHYQSTVTAGLPPPTGAELDQVAMTNNYGRAVLRKWRRMGRRVAPVSATRQRACAPMCSPAARTVRCHGPPLGSGSADDVGRVRKRGGERQA